MPIHRFLQYPRLLRGEGCLRAGSVRTVARLDEGQAPATIPLPRIPLCHPDPPRSFFIDRTLYKQQLDVLPALGVCPPTPFVERASVTTGSSVVVRWVRFLSHQRMHLQHALAACVFPFFQSPSSIWFGGWSPLHICIVWLFVLVIYSVGWRLVGTPNTGTHR